MKKPVVTKAVRMYDAFDLRLETFELPPIKDDEILVKVMSDSICMSSYKLVKQGKKHKRAPQDMDVNPIIMGHEFAGIVEVGDKWKDQFKAPGESLPNNLLNYKTAWLLPAIPITTTAVPGLLHHSHEVMELGALMKCRGQFL